MSKHLRELPAHIECIQAGLRLIQASVADVLARAKHQQPQADRVRQEVRSIIEQGRQLMIAISEREKYW